MAIPAFTTYTHPSANNVYLPNVDETLRLLVSYARNPKEFALNQYVTVSPISRPIGYYPKVFAADNVRVRSTTLADARWADGSRRLAGTGEYNTARHTFDNYTAVRYQFNATLGHETINYAEWDVKTMTRDNLASIAMTCRTYFVVQDIFDTSTNWPTNHFGTATATGGGLWGAGTITNPIIKNTLGAIRERISLDTNGKVSISDLRLVMNPTTARGIAQSQEIHTYLAQQVGSLDVLEGTNPSSGENWSLPKKLYGFEIVVDASNVSQAKESLLTQDTPTFIVPDNKIAVLARPGSLVSNGGSNFSTVHVLEMKGEAFNVEEKDDAFNRLMDIFVTDYYTPKVAAPESGFILTSVLS
jgi:hypothetical protein